MKKLIFILISATSLNVFAWGHRGHEIVASVAARLLEEKESMKYLLENEFSLGYYTNVPDMIWKNLGKETYETERPQHYMDWSEKLASIFQKPQNIPLAFDEYKKKMGDKYDPNDGRSPWRIKQFFEKCQELARNLTREKQMDLLLCAGILSHYTGDLSQPLHATNNFDGQLTGQKGIHSFFEDDMVNLLDPQLKVSVLKKAMTLYAKEVKKNRDYNQLVRDLITESHGRVDTLLKLDKKIGRKNNQATAEQYRPLIEEFLARGAVYTALVWKEFFKNVKRFDNHRFYDFNGKPDYVQP